MRENTLGLSGRLLESAEAWLAINIYHEARGEPYHCQVMVGEVAVRRAASKYFPNTIKEVVLEPYQFSWTIGKSRFDLSLATEENRLAAREALSSFYYTRTELHYARYDVGNYWTKSMYPPTMQCGNHVFYDNGGKR